MAMAPDPDGAQGDEDTVGDGEDWDAPGEPSELSTLSAQTEWMNQQSMVRHPDDQGAGMTAPMMNELLAANQPVIVDDTNIINVWKHNLEDAFKEISDIVQTHPYVAMDTEFPGVVARPYGTFRSHTDYQYQLGLTFSDDNGNLHERCTWQFHFSFDLDNDIFAQDSIDLLRKAGVDFEKHQKDGIDVEEFGGLFMRCDGFPFIRTSILGARLRIQSTLMTNQLQHQVSGESVDECQGRMFVPSMSVVEMSRQLPEKESDFFALLGDYFPCFFDIKYIMKSCESLKGGLNRIAETLEVCLQVGWKSAFDSARQVKRVGPSHQAGSDSLVGDA
eukprot:750519-Hanusia_phi.AAC.2